MTVVNEISVIDYIYVIVRMDSFWLSFLELSFIKGGFFYE